MKTSEDFSKVLAFMSDRKFLTSSSTAVAVDQKIESHLVGQSFLYNLLLPFVETYWITIAYFAVGQNRKIAHDEDNVYQKIQWFLETFYSDGILKFYESCMLESIKNAVRKFIALGILQTQKVQVKKTVFKTYFRVAIDEEKLSEFFSNIGFYLPYSASADLDFFQKEMTKLTVSDI